MTTLTSAIRCIVKNGQPTDIKITHSSVLPEHFKLRTEAELLYNLEIIIKRDPKLEGKKLGYFVEYKEDYANAK